MKKAPMFLAFWKRAGDRKLLLADQVVISDWESRDFGGNVYVAPNDSVLESRCAHLGAGYQFTHLHHRNVQRDGFRISRDVCAA